MENLSSGPPGLFPDMLIEDINKLGKPSHENNWVCKAIILSKETKLCLPLYPWPEGRHVFSKKFKCFGLIFIRILTLCYSEEYPDYLSGQNHFHVIQLKL